MKDLLLLHNLKLLNQYIQIADKKISNEIEELPTCITDEDIAK